MAEEPAFPVITWGRPDGLEMMQFQAGMTKRELIAMHAMAGMLASEGNGGTELFYTTPNAARRAVEMADALLAALGEQS